MQAFLAFFIGSSLKAIVYRVMAILGLGVITYTGSQTLLTSLVNQWLSQANQIPPEWLGILGYCNVDRGFSMIVSAIGIKLSVGVGKKFIGVKSS